MPFQPGQSGNPRGRKPKAEKFARPIAAAEKKIADHLVELIELKLELARAGDGKAIEYLIDRIMGKPTERSEQEIYADVGNYVIDLSVTDDSSSETE